MYFGAAFFLASGSDVLAQRLRFNATMKTTDLIDKYEDALSIVNIAAYQHYGTKREFHGKVITVRAHDTRAIAVMLDVAVDDVGAKLAELDLLFVPPTA